MEPRTIKAFQVYKDNNVPKKIALDVHAQTWAYLIFEDYAQAVKWKTKGTHIKQIQIKRNKTKL